MPSNPNLFHYATSELSQDAAICWLVAHADCEALPELQHVARSFIALLWNRAHPDQPVTPEAIRLTLTPVRQHEHIDLYFEAEVVSQRVLFIIEDKTSTTHHSDQLARYKQVFPGRETVFVYLKTTYLFGHDHAAKEHGYIVIGPTDLDDFLRVHPVANDIYSDFRGHIAGLRSRIDGVLAQLLIPNGYKALSHDFAQYEVLRRLGRACRQTIGGWHFSKGSNPDGKPWTHFRFAESKESLGVTEVLFHRIDARQNDDGQRGMYLSTRQYATVKGKPEAQAQKLQRLQRHRQLFAEAVKEANVGLKFARPSADYRGANESEIGTLFFDSGANSVESVLRDFPNINDAFVTRLRATDMAPAVAV